MVYIPILTKPVCVQDSLFDTSLSVKTYTKNFDMTSTADTVVLALLPVLQIRRGKRDNLGIIFYLTHFKCML